MYRFALRPRWLLGHLLVVLAVAVCCALGLWQFDRARQTESRPLPATETAELAEVLPPGGRLTETAAGRSVRVTGRYDGERQLLVPDRVLNDRDGFYLIAPLVTADGTAVTVNRGWLPGSNDDVPEVPPVPGGEVTVTGRLTPAESPLDYPSRGGLPEGQVNAINGSALVNLWPYPIYDGHVELTGQDPAPDPAVAPLPPPVTERVSWDWQNLGYSGQWWVFAVIAPYFWWWTIRREAEDRRAAEDPAGAPAAAAATGARQDR
ncbi:SURF1 family protein [Allonocardiopsis opalescens]|uniref:SURF1-like protein n=1 Tax=Allonocardiopsis opalescens TaxID=1144618 RepID=A0A2T0Q6H6_9ACTN|nr:SURF1 family protein [Allonocardiopsis opalescens]PRX99415.1 cytochrome oxidase assembly protein ShyY1 [Allonocardiopsis opalescens]